MSLAARCRVRSCMNADCATASCTCSCLKHGSRPAVFGCNSAVLTALPCPVIMTGRPRAILIRGKRRRSARAAKRARRLGWRLRRRSWSPQGSSIFRCSGRPHILTMRSHRHSYILRRKRLHLHLATRSRAWFGRRAARSLHRFERVLSCPSRPLAARKAHPGRAAVPLPT